MPGINKEKRKTLNLWHKFSCSYLELFKRFLNNPLPYNNSSKIISYFCDQNVFFEANSQLFNPGTSLIITISNTLVINIKCISLIETDYFKQVKFHLEIPKTLFPSMEGNIVCNYISDSETLFNLSLCFNNSKIFDDIYQAIATPSNVKLFFDKINQSLFNTHQSPSCLSEKFYIEGNFSFVLKLMTNLSITIPLIGKVENNDNLLLKVGQCFVINVNDPKIINKDIVLKIMVKKVKITHNMFEVVVCLKERNGLYPGKINHLIVKKTNEKDKLMFISESIFERQICVHETKLVAKLKRKFFIKIFKIININYEKQKKMKFIS
jgi:hypothetical protein